MFYKKVNLHVLISMKADVTIVHPLRMLSFGRLYLEPFLPSFLNIAFVTLIDDFY